MKTLGWGWGLPRHWEGWEVFVVYLAGLLAGTLLISRSHTYFLTYTTALSTVLIFICSGGKGNRPSGAGVPRTVRLIINIPPPAPLRGMTGHDQRGRN